MCFSNLGIEGSCNQLINTVQTLSVAADSDIARFLVLNAVVLGTCDAIVDKERATGIARCVACDDGKCHGSLPRLTVR